MTIEARKYHDQYDAATIKIKEAVNDAFRAAAEELRDAGFATANDDRAEELVAAIYRYLIESETETTCPVCNA